jgi:hypothetical protein
MREKERKILKGLKNKDVGKTDTDRIRMALEMLGAAHGVTS